MSTALLVFGGPNQAAAISSRVIRLGADAVMIGRSNIYGLAVAGGAGVGAVLDILAAEMRSTLTLMGVASVADLNRDSLVAR